MTTLMDDLIVAHEKIQAAGESTENPVLADLREQFSAVINTRADAGDQGLPHQVLVFAGQLQTLCTRAKKRVEAQRGEASAPYDAALDALKQAKAAILSPDPVDTTELMAKIDAILT